MARQIADVPGLRPTSERIRETLFNWLAPRIRGATCLDLCAGTGALGIEARSRGAERVVFVERSTAAARVIKNNISALGDANAEILNADARAYLGGPPVLAFDIVFLDPPFAADLHGELCRLLTEQDWLAVNARVYIEMHKNQADLALPDGWRIVKDKTAGNVRYLLATVDI